MKKVISLMFLGLFCFSGAAKAQTPEELIEAEEWGKQLQYNPRLIWKEFLGEKATISELATIHYNGEEPYKTWSAEEILNRTQSAQTMEFGDEFAGSQAAFYLIRKNIQPQADQAWRWLESNGGYSLLSVVLSNAPENYQRRAMEAIERQIYKFNAAEFSAFIQIVPERYRARIWNLFLSMNPSETALSSLARRGSVYSELALDQLLAFNAEDETLARILLDADETLKEKIVPILLGRNPNKYVLEIIAQYGPQAYKDFAEEQLRLLSPEKKEILIKLILSDKKPPQN